MLALGPPGLRSTPQAGWIGIHMASIRLHCHNNNLDKVGRRQANKIERNNDENIVSIDTIPTEENANQLEHGTNLHNVHSITPMGPTEIQLTAEASAQKEKASQMFDFVHSHPGNYGVCEIDTTR